MPSYAQDFLIKNLNPMLVEHGVQLPKDGVCNAFTSLYIDCVIKGQKHISWLKEMIVLATTPQESLTKKDKSQLLGFVYALKAKFDPKKYNNEINQTDIQKHSRNRYGERNEKMFQLALFADVKFWCSLLNRLRIDGVVMQINSLNHSMAMRVEGDVFILHDPNFDCYEKRFVRVDLLVNEIKKCFQYNAEELGIRINVFNLKDKELLPQKTDELYDKVFKNNYSDEQKRKSLLIAINAGDIDTVKYLLSLKTTINSDMLKMAVLRNRKEVIDLLLDAHQQGNRFGKYQAYDMLKVAVRSASLEVVKQLIEWTDISYQTASMNELIGSNGLLIKETLRNRDRRVYQYIKKVYVNEDRYSRFSDEEKQQIIIEATKQEHLDAVKDFTDCTDCDAVFVANQLEYCIESHNHEMMRFWGERVTFTVFKSANNNNNNNDEGELEQFRYYKAAIKANNTEAIEWLKETGNLPGKREYAYATGINIDGNNQDNNERINRSRGIVKAMLADEDKQQKSTDLLSSNKQISVHKSSSNSFFKLLKNNKKDWLKTHKASGLYYIHFAIINGERKQVKDWLRQLKADHELLPQCLLLACEFGQRDIAKDICLHSKGSAFDSEKIKQILLNAMDNSNPNVINSCLSVGMFDHYNDDGDEDDIIDKLLQGNFSSIVLEKIRTIENLSADTAYYFARCAIVNHDNDILSEVMPYVADDPDKMQKLMKGATGEFYNSFACKLILETAYTNKAQMNDASIIMNDASIIRALLFALKSGDVDIVSTLVSCDYIAADGQSEFVGRNNSVKSVNDYLTRFPSSKVLHYFIKNNARFNEKQIQDLTRTIIHSAQYESLLCLYSNGLLTKKAVSPIYTYQSLKRLCDIKSYAVISVLSSTLADDIKSGLEGAPANSNNNNNVNESDDDDVINDDERKNITDVFVRVFIELIQKNSFEHYELIFDLIKAVGFNFDLIKNYLFDAIDSNNGLLDIKSKIMIEKCLNDAKAILFKESIFTKMFNNDSNVQVIKSIISDNQNIAGVWLKDLIKQAANAAIGGNRKKIKSICTIYKEHLDYDFDELIRDLVKDLVNPCTHSHGPGQCIRNILSVLNVDDIDEDTYQLLLVDKNFATIKAASYAENFSKANLKQEAFVSSIESNARQSSSSKVNISAYEHLKSLYNEKESEKLAENKYIHITTLG